MKLQLETRGALNFVTACEAGRVVVNGRALTRSFLLMPELLDEQWGPGRQEFLTNEHLRALTGIPCDVLLIGTGVRQRFPPPEQLRPLIEAGRSYEIMDTAAACRTYNVLVAEGRLVLAALILEPADGVAP